MTHLKPFLIIIVAILFVYLVITLLMNADFSDPMEKNVGREVVLFGDSLTIVKYEIVKGSSYYVLSNGLLIDPSAIKSTP